MSLQFRRRIALSVQQLEGRDQPSTNSVLVDPTTYAADHIIVKWTDGQFHKTNVTTTGEALGDGQYKVKLAEYTSAETAVAFLAQQKNVQFAQLDYKLKIENLPNDPSLNNQWGLNNTGQAGGTANDDIRAVEAWNTNTGSGKMVVAVIDSGIDYNHPDLAGNLWKNPKETNKNGKDDDRNGYTDDVYGWNFVNNSANVMDDNGHGTHVAGIIGAVGDNGIGVTGVNWDIQIMTLKFLDKDGSGYMSNAVKAVNYAVANGAKVINNSYAGGGSDPAMQSAINAARAKGVIYVAAAGNDGSNNDADPVYPANYSGDNVVTVAASDRNDKLASFSNYGKNTVEIAAPGQSIYSTLPGNKYGYYSGTSMAAPFVTGAMALVWDANPTWTYKQVIDAVLKTADVEPGLTGKVATGRLDVAAAINYNGKPTTPPTAKSLQVTSATFNTGTTLNRVRITFNQPINPTTFTAADVTLTGPAGRLTVNSITAVSGSNNTQFDVNFSSQQRTGSYQITLGTQIATTSGTLLDQDGDGKPAETTDGFTGSTTLTGTTPPNTSTKAKTVRSSTATPLLDNGRTVATITITDNVTIDDLNVTLNITHPRSRDLKISLISPDGTRVYLINQRGTTANLTNTTFDDAAGTRITAANTFSGTFRPETSLSQFSGKLTKGQWRLVVEDMNRGNAGTLQSWSITYTARTTGSATALIAAPTRKFLNPNG